MNKITTLQESAPSVERKGRLAKALIPAALAAAALTGCTVNGGAPAEVGELKTGSNKSDNVPAGIEYQFTDTEGRDAHIFCAYPYDEESTITVEKGDTLRILAEDVGLYWSSVDQELPSKDAVVDVIALLNELDDENIIHPGQELLVPAWCDTPRQS